MDMTIRDVMRACSLSVLPTQTLGAAHRLMATTGIHNVPVTRDGRVVGLLSERDVVATRARLEGHEVWWPVEVRRAMTTPVYTAHPDDSLTSVAACLARYRLDAMPVVEDGRLIGIATATDILEAEARTVHP